MALPPGLAWTEGRKATADSLRVLSVDDLISTSYLSCLTVDFTGWVANIRLFLGQPVNRADQQDHHQYADHVQIHIPPPIHPYAWFITESLSLRCEQPSPRDLAREEFVFSSGGSSRCTVYPNENG